MKILWISRMPCGAISTINPNIQHGGWLGALENALARHPEIELHECYWCEKDVKDFVYNGVYNHPVYDPFYSSKKYFIMSQLSILAGHLMYNKRLDRMEQIIKDVKPDLIHIHGTESELGLLAERIPDIPCVFSIQGIINPIQSKQYAGIPHSEVSKRDSLYKLLTLKSSKYGEKGWKLYQKREAEILRNSKHLIGRTDWDRAVSTVLAPQAQYYHGGELLRNAFYQCQPWGKTSFGNPFSIVTIITNGLYKGFETVLQTAKLLKDYGFDFNWTIIGQNQNSSQITLFENYTKIKCKDVNIQLVGSKRANEITDILQQGDLYCQVSHIENSPNSVCEAMLTGIPVIASFAGGTNSIVKHKENGLLFQEGEYFSLAGMIIELSRNFSFAKEMAEAGRLSALSRHNPQLIQKQYIDIYQQIITNSNLK